MSDVGFGRELVCEPPQNPHPPHPTLLLLLTAANVRLSAESPMRNADFYLLPVFAGLDVTDDMSTLENGIPTVRDDGRSAASCRDGWLRSHRRCRL